MKTKLINEGGEVIGTRMTVYNLLSDFLDPTKTESGLCTMYGLSAEQIAAARAFILNNPDSVLARHLEIEKRMAAGNTPAVLEQAKKTHASFVSFKEWLADREKAENAERSAETKATQSRNGASSFPTFREWLAQREASLAEGS